MIQKSNMLAMAVLLVSVAAWAEEFSELTVDNLMVNQDAAICGKLDVFEGPVTVYAPGGDIPMGVFTNGLPPVSAFGGTITTSGNYRIHTFTEDGTFQVANGCYIPCEVLIVAGGAGGGANQGAGGGGGGVIQMTNTLSGSYTVTIGTGGVGAATESSFSGDGGYSQFGTNIAIGGGGGGSWAGGDAGKGHNGGSGGGAGLQTGVIGTGVVCQGHNGGTSLISGTQNVCGGGGGAMAVGGNGVVSSPYSRGGNGGAGLVSSISGDSHTYASGGGGYASADTNQGYTADDSYGVGGTGAGDGGVVQNSSVVRYCSPATYYGCGGGGGGWNNSSPKDESGKAGYQGIVIVRYAIP